MHKHIFQDLYEWAGQQRKQNIYKEEPILGGLSIDYADMFDIQKDSERILTEMRNKPWNDMGVHEAAKQFSQSMAMLWKVHPFREGNTRTIVTLCCQYADEVGLCPDRKLFENNAQYVRVSLVAYNAIFGDIGDKSQPQYLISIVEDAFVRGKDKRI